MKEKIKKLLDYFLYLVSVPKCVFCNERLDFNDEALCPNCKTLYTDHKMRNCSRCAKTLSDCSCSPAYLYTHYVKKLVKVFRYTTTAQETPWNYLLYSLKQSNRKDVFDFLAKEAAEAIRKSIKINDPNKFIITICPRRKGGVIEYGYDHSEEIAKRLSKEFGIEYVKLLKSNSKKPQKSTHGIIARLSNLNYSYRRNTPNLEGYTVLLIDDIVTTGATMGTCASLIRGLGTKKIIGVTIGVAYKDRQTLYIDPKLPRSARLQSIRKSRLLKKKQQAENT